MHNLRAVAFVLPQYHPIPENDAWWGEGFTEWTNVRKAKPLFEGHYQPHIPTTQLGYYDLRKPEAREAQAQLAKRYGIHGFCYYHYWFNGKRLLNYPIDAMLDEQKPNIPFMLCWANENWTRRWDGKQEDVLIAQEYSFEDDTNHIRWLCSHVFNDRRYIRVNDCPIFMIYRHNLFPNIEKTAKIWRKIAKEEFGFKDLYLCITESFNDVTNPESIGFDAAVEFAPHRIIKNRMVFNFKDKLLQMLGLKNNFANIDLRDFKKGVEQSINRVLPKYKLYRCVTPSWDNTARKKTKGIISMGSSPKQYYNWLRFLKSKFTPYSREENFIFINAMNEWAEGNHLEPCEKYGLGYLEATKKAMEE